MRRRFALLLFSALLAFALTACGGDDKNAGTQNGTTDSAVTDQSDDPLLGGGTDSTMDDGTAGTGDQQPSDTDGSGLVDDVEDGLENFKDDLETDMETGTSYDQMVRNGTVHDSDGILTDGENAVTPGAA